MAEIGSIVAEKAIESLVDSTSTQLGYIWNYKSNFENLEKQLRELRGRNEMMQHWVDEAKRNGEEIEQEVVNWLDEVNKMVDEVTQIIEDNKKAEMKCFKSLCPNLKKRYQHSKNAVVKAKDVSQLHNKGTFDRISYRNIPKEMWHPSNKLYEDFDSRMSILTEVINALSSPNVNVVGVHGMGGIGKTTLAREVGRMAEEKELFNSVVFVEVSEQPDVEKIQQVIADRLGLTFCQKSLPEKAKALCERLKQERKILLILDNMWKSLDLEKVGIPLNDDHRGCKLLFTARNTNVLSMMDCQINFLIGILNEKEAWNLFEKIAGSCVQHYHDLAFDVAKRCGGLPIAIVTVAKALKNKQVFEWRTALLELQHPSSESQDDSVTQEAYSYIRLSYNRLTSDELRSTFLLCCKMVLIFHASLEELLRYGLGLNLFKRINKMEEARDRVNTLIQKLKDSSLLLETSNDEHFSIHDVVRDVGRVIAVDNHENFIMDDRLDLSATITLENCTSISLLNIAELPEELDCPHLTFFYMKTKTKLSIPDNFFNGMPKLEVLHLEEMDLSELPTSLPSLKKLRTLYLDCCDLEDIAIIGDIKYLEILVLFYSQSAKKLLSEEIGKLNRLRLLDLRQSSFIIPPKTISSLTQLEELYMDDWYDQQQAEELHIETSVASLNELKDLCHLTALHIHVADAQVLPKSMVFQKLKRYEIVIEDKQDIGETSFGSFFETWSIIETLRTLRVRSDTNLCLEDGVIKQLKGIEDLLLDGKQRITNVLCELDGEGFPKLKHFRIGNNPFILRIVDSMSSATCDAFPLLETLSLWNLVRLEKICHDQLRTKCFCQLRTIEVQKCHKLKNLFSFSIAKHLSLLEEIEVVDCENIEEIFFIDRADNGVTDPVFFEQLRSLTLEHLPRLRRFCSEIEMASTEQETRMPLTMNASSSEIVLNDQLDALPLFGEKVVFLNLNCLRLRDINLKRIWPNQLPSLSCWVQNLRMMSINDYSNLKYVFSSSTLGSFNHLQDLQISGCEGLEELIRIDDKCSNYVEFPSLQKLDIDNCLELRNFIFSDKVSYPSLQEIRIKNMQNLKRIWQSQVIQSVQYCPKLCRMELWFCQSLENIFPASIARSLLQLEVLEVNRCGIKEIVAKEGGVEEAAARFSFPQLTSLTLLFLEELRCFYPGKHTTEWSKLKELSVEDCEKLDVDPAVQQPLFSADKVFFHLEKLTISKKDFRMICQSLFAEKLKSLVVKDDKSTILSHSTFEKFHNLEELQLISSWYKVIFSCEEVDKHVGMFAPLKRLHLIGLRKLKQIWKQVSKMDLIIQKLEFLEVSYCRNLINLTPPSASFKNLKILEVDRCARLISLVSTSAAKSLMLLEEMSIIYCEQMTEIIENEGDVMEGKITLSRLKSLKLEGLANLTSFYSGNDTFNFPLLEKLTVNNCPELKVFSSGAVSTPKLQEVWEDRTRYKCKKYPNLNATFKEIRDKKVFSILERSFLRGEDLKLVWNLFPERTKVFSNVEQLNLSGSDIGMMWQIQLPELILPKLKCLCVSKDLSKVFLFGIFQRFHDVEKLELQWSLYEEIFPYEEVAKYAWFPAQIKCLRLAYLGAVKQLWKKDSELNLLQNLENLEVEECESLNNVLLPSSSFENLKIMKVNNCKKLISLMVASTTKSLVQLEEIQISHCKMMTQVVANEGDIVEDKITFHKLKKLELNDLSCLTSFSFGNYSFEIPFLEILIVKECPKMEIFALGNLNTPALQEVWLDHIDYLCKIDLNEIVRQHHEKMIFSRKKLGFKNIKMMLQKVPEHQKVFSNLEQLNLRKDEIGMLWQSQFPQQLFPRLKLLEFFDDESTVFPLAILQRFHSVDELELNCSSYEEIFSCEDFEKYAGAFAQIKSLSLYGLDNLKQMWKQDSSLDLILQNVESLRVEWCGSLVTLLPPSSSFRNLTRLSVEGCDGLMNLLAPETAKSLVQLETLAISKCKLMTEVISSNEEAVTDDEIIFSSLEYLTLRDLSSLSSFCLGNYTITFPHLWRIHLYKCPKIESFSLGVLNTPQLEEIRHDDGLKIESFYFCDDDLNAAIQEIHEKLNAKTSPKDCTGPSTPSSSVN